MPLLVGIYILSVSHLLWLVCWFVLTRSRPNQFIDKTLLNYSFVSTSLFSESWLTQYSFTGQFSAFKRLSTSTVLSTRGPAPSSACESPPTFPSLGVS